MKRGKASATYRMGPSNGSDGTPDTRFIPRAVKEIVDDQMKKTLATMKEYDDETAKEVAKTLCSEIKERVKSKLIILLDPFYLSNYLI